MISMQDILALSCCDMAEPIDTRSFQRKLNAAFGRDIAKGRDLDRVW